jgi:transposase-like protein
MEKTIGIIYAPIEIENPGQLESLGITWKDVVPLKVANRIIDVYLVPAPEEVSRYMLKELRNKYHQEERVKRCKVQGAGRKLVNCIDSISCMDCPHNKNGVEKTLQLVSLDAILESGWDCESCDSDLQEQLEFGEMLDRIGEASPLCRTVLTQYIAGYTLDEIAAHLGIPRTNVFRVLSKAREIARRYRDEE